MAMGTKQIIHSPVVAGTYVWQHWAKSWPVSCGHVTFTLYETSTDLTAYSLPPSLLGGGRPLRLDPLSSSSKFIVVFLKS